MLVVILGYVQRPSWYPYLRTDDSDNIREILRNIHEKINAKRATQLGLNVPRTDVNEYCQWRGVQQSSERLRGWIRGWLVSYSQVIEGRWQKWAVAVVL